MPSVLRPDESGTAGTNSPRSVNQNDRRNHISGPGSNVPIPQSIPINGTAINGITSSGHIASKPTSGQYTETTPTSGAINSSMVQAVTALDEEEIAAINASFDLPMRQNLTRSSSMEVLVGDRAENSSNGD